MKNNTKGVILAKKGTRMTWAIMEPRHHSCILKKFSKHF